MQTVSAPATSPATNLRPMASDGPATSVYQGYQIIRRNGAVVSFEPNKIAVALMKAFLRCTARRVRRRRACARRSTR